MGRSYRVFICLCLVMGMAGCDLIGGGRDIAYEPLDFKGDLDWQRVPGLVRMMPDAGQPTFRRPADPSQDQAQLLKPVSNVIVLVHGHNEQEKDGRAPTTAPEPWRYTYKMQVWTVLYKIFLEQNKDDLLNCTAFYEFIYPSYLPALGSVKSKPEVKTLGVSLAEALSVGAPNDGFQIGKLKKAHMNVNLFLVAHSMGGLVARAGIQLLDKETDTSFRRLVTWGTPHRGSALVSLSYAIKEETYKIVKDNPVCQTQAQAIDGQRAYLAALQLDTPGTQDCRWEKGNADDLLLACIFRKGDAAKPEFDLVKGGFLYSENVRLLNAGDRYPQGEKYTLMYGIAPEASWTSGKDTNVGATLHGAIVKDARMASGALREKAQSDGAVQLSSASAAGLFPQATRVNLGAMDHEQYYENGANGEKAARATLEALGLAQPRCTCPMLEVDAIVDPAAGTCVIQASLDLDPSLDPTPNKRVKKVEARVGAPSRVLLELTRESKGDSGMYSGSLALSQLPDSANVIFCRAELQDGTLVESASMRIAASGPAQTGRCLCDGERMNLLMPPMNSGPAAQRWQECYNDCMERCGCSPKDAECITRCF